MKKLVTLMIAASLSSVAFAAPETYVIDNNHSKPRFEYDHMGVSIQLSRFDSISGIITIDRAAKTGMVEVTIDAKSVDSGSAEFNGHLQGEDFFNTAKYPTITYKSNKFQFAGDKVVSVEGDLTIKGVTKPVTLTVNSFNCIMHPMMHKEDCGVTATAKVKRSDFNMGKYVPLVGDEVTLTLPVESFKQ